MNNNINKCKLLSQGLSLLAYNGNDIKTPKDNQLNIYMGIGLWSVKDGLSKGLPIDVMQMLLLAAIMRWQIKEANLKQSSKIIILIADSMAIREGAEREKVSQMTLIYKNSLEPLLDLLKLKEDAEILLSSTLEKTEQYQVILKSVEENSILKRLKNEDEIHYAYIRTQTAITHYMNKCREVGIKVGWISDNSSKQLTKWEQPYSLKSWDELKFDRWYEVICENSKIQCLYSKAGIKQPRTGKNINVREGCPYTACDKDQRYIIQTQKKQDIKTICPLQNRVATHWRGIAELCLSLMDLKIVDSILLPKDCINTTNAKITVSNLLNHWSNVSVPSKYISVISNTIVCSELIAVTLDISYRKLVILKTKMEIDKSKDQPKCIII